MDGRHRGGGDAARRAATTAGLPHRGGACQRLSAARRGVSPETHGSALEIKTGVHENVAGAVAELRDAASGSASESRRWGCASPRRAPPAGVWSDSRVSGGERYQSLYGSMRELARREPTFALHVHIGVPDRRRRSGCDRPAADICRCCSRSRRTPPSGRGATAASPRPGPRSSRCSRALAPRARSRPTRLRRGRRSAPAIRSVPDPTYLWWDVRPQPEFGTLEVRIMDAQSTSLDPRPCSRCAVGRAAAERAGGYLRRDSGRGPDENRFFASRDGMDARLIDSAAGRRRPARELLEETLELCAAAGEALGCASELAVVRALSLRTPAHRQRALARRGDKLPGSSRGSPRSSDPQLRCWRRADAASRAGIGVGARGTGPRPRSCGG